MGWGLDRIGRDEESLSCVVVRIYGLVSVSSLGRPGILLTYPHAKIQFLPKPRRVLDGFGYKTQPFKGEVIVR